MATDAPFRPNRQRMVESWGMAPEWLRDELAKPGRSQSALARFMGLSSAAIVNRMTKGSREISAKEADKIRAYLSATMRGAPAEPLEEHIGNTPDLPLENPTQDYVPVEVLPTFAGMGGGGTGDGDREVALVPRRLIEDELRGRAGDMLLVNVRGTSMEPLFFQGDQLLIDQRDKSPTQAGPFAILYDDGYAVKNVTWVAERTRLRISSANPEFPPEELPPDRVTIIGRPVWVGRRL